MTRHLGNILLTATLFTALVFASDGMTRKTATTMSVVPKQNTLTLNVQNQATISPVRYPIEVQQHALNLAQEEADPTVRLVFERRKELQVESIAKANAEEKAKTVALAKQRLKVRLEAKQQVAEYLKRANNDPSTLSSRASGVLGFQVSVSPWMDMTATWYDDQGGINGSGLTATGAPLKADYTIAVDPTVIPLGSIVEVRQSDGQDRLYKAEDTGGAIKGHRIDIYDPNVKSCIDNGVQEVMLRVWKVKSNQNDATYSKIKNVTNSISTARG